MPAPLIKPRQPQSFIRAPSPMIPITVPIKPTVSDTPIRNPNCFNGKCWRNKWDRPIKAKAEPIPMRARLKKSPAKVWLLANNKQPRPHMNALMARSFLVFLLSNNTPTGICKAVYTI